MNQKGPIDELTVLLLRDVLMFWILLQNWAVALNAIVCMDFFSAQFSHIKSKYSTVYNWNL